MKKVLLITFVAVCFCQVSTAQNNAKIDTLLQQEMALRNASELIGINIILNQQYNQMDMRKRSGAYPKKETKRNFVVGELKRFSEETQRNIMNYLKLFSEKLQVSNIQSHWIYNGIYCHATKNVIEELAIFDDILIIGFNKQYKLAPDDKKTDVTDASREITYNVLKVNANQVWDLGYRGEGVIVAVADCGVNYNHYDLRDHMWEHPNFPYHGWNFVFDNNDPMDLEGHGTHCAGTVAGDGTAGSQTGIAPKATIMALKVWDDSQGLGDANTMSSGFAFAVEHGAHVISMSGGVPQMFITNADKIILRNTMVNVLEAGVIAAVAAGNEGTYYSPPNSVRSPSSCPPPWLHLDQTTIGGVSCVMSVGATDINDNIADFSSRGPVTWQSISGYNDYPYNPGIGLIRPDVCAPGVNIKSLDYANPTGYASGWSGTSMATPCVAGVMALMLSKNINLTPAEICEILETTALPLSPTKSNIYGSGRINALAAVESVPLSISGPSTVCTIGTYTLSNNAPATWSVAPTNAFTVTAQIGTSATVKALVLSGQSGTLTAIMGTGATITKAIQACMPTISGSSAVCGTSTYTLSGALANSWSITPSGAFSITVSNTSSATVVPRQFSGQSGTLTAMVDGIAIKKVISTCKPGILCDGMFFSSCTNEYYLNNLPAGVVQGTWTLTDNSKLQITNDKGINGCTVKRKPFYAYNPDPFETSPVTYYPYGTTDLIFTFNLNGSTYTTTAFLITFGFTPEITGVYQMSTNQPAPYSNGIYTLSSSSFYYFTAELQEGGHIHGTYRWVATPQGGILASPSSYTGKNTMSTPANFSVPGAYQLSAAIVDGCGIGEKVYRSLIVTNSGSSSGIYSLYPNPVNSDLFFTRLPGVCRVPDIGSVMIINIVTQTVVFNQSGYNLCSSFSINVSNIPNGWYSVCIVRSSNIIQQETILVQH